MTAFETSVVEIADLERHPLAARRAGLPAAVEAIEASLQEFGMVEPVVVNASNQVLYGWARVQMLEELGETEVLVAHCPPDWDADTQVAFSLAVDKISGRWEPKKLRGVLKDLRANNVNMQPTGFLQGEISAILGDPSAPEEPKKPKGESQTDKTPRFRLGLVSWKLPPDLWEALNEWAKEKKRSEGWPTQLCVEMMCAEIRERAQ